MIKYIVHTLLLDGGEWSFLVLAPHRNMAYAIVDTYCSEHPEIEMGLMNEVDVYVEREASIWTKIFGTRKRDKIDYIIPEEYSVQLLADTTWQDQ